MKYVSFVPEKFPCFVFFFAKKGEREGHSGPGCGRINLSNN